ncbi:MAG: hypothetical protein WCJ35_00400 [Planctomycetota bacterium]
MRFLTGYNLIELSATNLRRPRDPRAVGLPTQVIGFLDLMRAFQSGAIDSWSYGSELTVVGVEQFLRNAADPVEMAKYIHDRILYDQRVYRGLGKLEASLVIVCDGEFDVGQHTFQLRIGQMRLPLGLLFVAQPQILPGEGNQRGYHVPFKLSG